MFNGFNGQQHENYAAWQMSYGNLQGNYSAPTVPNSFPQANSFQGQHDPYAHYGAYPHQSGWQPPNPALAYHQQQQHAMAQQQYHYQYYCPPTHPEQLPPLPNGAPPPLPTTPAEEPPPLPPDAGPAPLPPLPEAQPAAQQPLPQQSQPPAVYHPPGVAGADAHGGAPFQHPGNANSQPGPAQANMASWSQHLNPHHSQQGPYHPTAGQSAQAPYPTFQHHPPQPPTHQHSAYTQPPTHQHHHHHPSALPPGQQQTAAAPSGSSYAGAAGSGSHPTPATPALAPVPVVVDITRLLRPPHRATRPRKLLLVLRGLPGSGKSALARKIREAELEAGAEAPRLHSMDDYYMQEVEVEVVEEEGGRKKRRKVTEVKYVHEPDMEGPYFRDLVRAVGRSCEDRRYSFVVVDAPVLRGEQLRELMAVGQRANFECFALLPLETDPSVVAAPGRNLHGHSAEALRQMATQFEAAPPLYTQVSAVSLFGGPVVGEEQQDAADGGGAKSKASRSSGEIQEVEMDMEDSEDGADDGEDADGEAAAASGSRRRRPTSRWHDDDGGGDGRGGGGSEQRQRRKKRDKARELRAVADIDEDGILLGLNDAMAAASDGGGGAARPAARSDAAAAKRAVGPLRSALRRAQSVASVAVSATAVGDIGTAGRRRVWWPDVGQESTAAAAAAEAESTTAVAAAASARVQLVEVVYLEGLGPPAELEDLPYGYQRRSAGARGEAGSGGVEGAGVAAGAAAVAVKQQPLGGPHAHGSFRDQAKAEHESEHDLFRRLLLGRQAGGAVGGHGTAGGAQQQQQQQQQLGMFAAPADEED